MAEKNTGAAFLTGAVPALDAEEVPGWAYVSLAAVIMKSAKAVDPADPDRILWETDHDAWVRAQKAKVR